MPDAAPKEEDMSRPVLTRLVAVVAAVMVTGAILSAAPLHTRAHALVGTLQKVDGQTLTIQTSKGTESVTLAPSAKIRVGTKTMTVADLSNETGARVKVHYSEKKGEKQAQSVTVRPANKSAQTARADSKPNPKVTRK
jgi:hypothetical protein